MIMFAVPLLYQIYASTVGSSSEDAQSSSLAQRVSRQQASQDDAQAEINPRMMNMMGLMQWMIIGQFSVFYLTYATDLWCVVKYIQQQEGAER